MYEPRCLDAQVKLDIHTAPQPVYDPIGIVRHELNNDPGEEKESHTGICPASSSPRETPIKVSKKRPVMYGTNPFAAAETTQETTRGQVVV